MFNWWRLLTPAFRGKPPFTQYLRQSGLTDKRKGQIGLTGNVGGGKAAATEAKNGKSTRGERIAEGSSRPGCIRDGRLLGQYSGFKYYSPTPGILVGVWVMGCIRRRQAWLRCPSPPGTERTEQAISTVEQSPHY
ncbi:hypothetical protein CIHG_04562 [Coccidioides immitis H538.4]|uniref:Uncharacterized protein n=1 Tax=Coccidioides immitis H538.4 TaxID=396776 RepID=A0A0J8UH72_COCIT|nr:hypothetical protein CIHG_04562 [Coccidioides immitis H538.4]